MNFEITNDWAALGTTLGATLTVQNKGRAGDIIEVITGDTKPLESDRGLALAQINQMYRISGYTGLVWVRYIRYDLTGSIHPLDARICLLDVQEGGQITEVSDIPIQLLTTPDLEDSTRLKVSTATRQELQIAQGTFFNGILTRNGILVDDTYYAVLKAPADKFLVVEDANVDTDFQVDDSSTFSVSIDTFVDISSGNTWIYTPVSPAPAGRPLNAIVVNNLADSTIDLDVPIAGFTGLPDYAIFFSKFYLETQGQRETITTTGKSFFDNGRQIVLGPGQELLVRTQTGGNSIGTLDLRVTFFLSEIPVNLVPSLLGVAI